MRILQERKDRVNAFYKPNLEPRVSPAPRSADGRWVRLCQRPYISQFSIGSFGWQNNRTMSDHPEVRKSYPEVNQAGNPATTLLGLNGEFHSSCHKTITLILDPSQ